jgi:hypothetical protein
MTPTAPQQPVLKTLPTPTKETPKALQITKVRIDPRCISAPFAKWSLMNSPSRIFTMISTLRFAAGVAIFAFIPMAQAGAEEPVSIVCEKVDAINADWKGPLEVTYAGSTERELTVTSEHVSLKLPATQTERSGAVDGG